MPPGSPWPDGGRPAADPLTARSPDLDTDMDRLVEHARFVATEPTRTDQWGRSGNEPGYDVSAGDRVLLVADTFYDREVLDAFVEAFHDVGAKADVVVNDVTNLGGDEIDPWLDEIPGLTRPEVLTDDRFDAIPGLMTAADRFLERGVPPIVGGEDLLWWEEVAEGYDLLVYGIGGPTPYDTPERAYRYERIPYLKRESLASDFPTFPRDLWALIDEKTAETIVNGRRMRLTDPEGTDLRWTNYVTGIYPRDRPCHIFAHPLLPTARTDTHGVIKGTTNHVNAFPHIAAHIEDGRVTRIEGGGEYGERWRRTLDVMGDFDDAYGEIWREVFDDWQAESGADEFSFFDGSPGFFWLWELVIGTNPKCARPHGRDVTRFPFPLIERMRTGVIHCGMGTPISLPAVERRARDRGMPWGHVHIHVVFPTLEVEDEQGRTTTLIEDGYLTVLDDPEVRSLAAEYGDPDDLLSVDWVPSIPGVSTPGEYESYSRDPKAWLREHTDRAGW